MAKTRVCIYLFLALPLPLNLFEIDLKRFVEEVLEIIKEIGLNVGEKKEEFKKISINFMPFLVNSWISLLERI